MAFELHGLRGVSGRALFRLLQLGAQSGDGPFAGSELTRQRLLFYLKLCILLYRAATGHDEPNERGSSGVELHAYTIEQGEILLLLTGRRPIRKDTKGIAQPADIFGFPSVSVDRLLMMTVLLVEKRGDIRVYSRRLAGPRQLERVGGAGSDQGPVV